MDNKRLRQILREEYLKATQRELESKQAIHDVYTGSDAGEHGYHKLSEAERVRVDIQVNALTLLHGMKRAVGDIISRVNEEEGTSFRRDGTKKPQRGGE